MKFNLVLISILFFSFNTYANEEKPEIPDAVLKKMGQLQKGELNQLEKIKLADELQRAGAKDEALALYDENLPKGAPGADIPPEAYLNYGTALLEKGEAQRGLSVYKSLNDSLDPKAANTAKIKDIIEKNLVKFFQVVEQKKQQQKKDDKEKKDNKDKGQKDQQQGESGSEKDQKQQKDGKDKGDPSKDETDKGKDKKDSEDKDKDKKDEKDKKDSDVSDKEGDKKKQPPPKITPKLKQLMSDDRQLQLKVIEQGTRDMNRRSKRENKDW